MSKKELKIKLDQLNLQKENLEMQLSDLNIAIQNVINLQKPYVANVSAYSGHYSMQFDTEEKARKKLSEYESKKYFKNGLNYGVYLYKWNADGSKTLMESIPVGRKNFEHCL